MRSDVKIIAIMDPGYTEGGYDRFIEYEFEKYFSYEYVQKEKDFKIIPEDKLKNKPNANSLKSKLKDLLEEFVYSIEDFMYFIEMDDETYSKEDIEEVSKEVNELGLNDYVKFGEDGAKITIYGGILTQFLYED